MGSSVIFVWSNVLSEWWLRFDTPFTSLGPPLRGTWSFAATHHLTPRLFRSILWPIRSFLCSGVQHETKGSEF